MVKRDDRWLVTVPCLPFSCSRCGKFKPRTYSHHMPGTSRLTRYHQCVGCQQKFRSEQITRADIRRWLTRDDQDIVPFLPAACPSCHSTRHRTYSVNTSTTNATMRYHTCNNCGERYRSVQIGRDGMQKWLPDADRIDLGRG